MVCAGVGDGTTTSIAESFDFSVEGDEEALIKKLEEVSLSGERINLHFVKRYAIFPWRGDTKYFVTSVEQAQEMHAHIRSHVAGKYGQDAADSISILYGGSCKPSNAAELFACPDVDGGLIGGASLKAEDFLGIIQAMVSTR